MFLKNCKTLTYRLLYLQFKIFIYTIIIVWSVMKKKNIKKKRNSVVLSFILLFLCVFIIFIFHILYLLYFLNYRFRYIKKTNNFAILKDIFDI